MSKIQAINRFYGSFFSGALEFAVSPYTVTFQAISGCDENFDGGSAEGFIIAGATCAFFSFVVPVLPVLTEITIALAYGAILLAAASALFTYPAALVADLFKEDSGTEVAATPTPGRI